MPKPLGTLFDESNCCVVGTRSLNILVEPRSDSVISWINYE